MNNLIIAAIAFVMLPAFGSSASAKTIKTGKSEKSEMIVEKINFNENISNATDYEPVAASLVDVDYIIEENGKAYITYISSDDAQAKNEVVKFIESASYNFNPI